MARTKTLSLSDETQGLLAQVGNASAYVERVVTDRWRAWQQSLAMLADDDMTTNEILACCDILNGYYLLEDIGGGMAGSCAAVALELHDGQALNRTAQKHGCDLERWRDLVLRVRDRQTLASAILAVSREFWSDNEACEAAIRRVDRIRLTGDVDPVLGPGVEAPIDLGAIERAIQQCKNAVVADLRAGVKMPVAHVITDHLHRAGIKTTGTKISAKWDGHVLHASVDRA